MVWLAGCAVLHGAGFETEWHGERVWTGPETWASPLYDWEVKDGSLVGVAAAGRVVQRLTERVAEPAKGFELRTTVEILTPDRPSNPRAVWAGFAVGIQGMMDDPRHVAVMPKRRVDAGLRADGRVFVDAIESAEVLAGAGPAELRLVAAGGTLTLEARRGGASVAVTSAIDPARLRGNLGLAADSPRRKEDKRGPIRARFGAWSGRGEGLAADPALAFGPVLWTQYMRQAGQAKLSVQMPPLGAGDPQEVTLELQHDGEWERAGTARIDPLARTAVFRCEIGAGELRYRVTYPWAGRVGTWDGTFAAEPAADVPLKIAVFSCDHGYAFPQPKMVRNVARQDPDLLFFSGDQIYEVYGGFGTTRGPLGTAMLDYLRKFYQFGWTWRSLLRDRPSVIIPDDHDVFQGNLWGAGGAATKQQESGGYVMPPEWVKAVERTQTGHLPDPPDPRPVQQGIGVYFTKFTFGGVPVAVLEDRKFKSGPAAVLPANRRGLTAAAADVAGAELLGARQEEFLRAWAGETAAAPLRLVLSQTIFCKAHTHSGAELRADGLDFDSNGWPQAGRRRALDPLRGGNTLMVHGDQHLGILLRHGLERHGDGPWAFMVPGSANGFPRAWWPEGGRVTGDFSDPFGNKFTVLAAANPERGSNTLEPRAADDPETTAHRKGSGHGLLVIAPDRRRVTCEMWRHDFDAANPRPQDQFEGFPVTVTMGAGE